ncbi:type II toxin-antitoxin system VapC family toxin [Fodinibius halophilus]|uniref:Type II toxin-antitoxin system VapC family toxin n=1 Tax=Fodinibius halophilus TaxID=1736908 RepID=A0A6M1TCT2_9BACT|nr:type II toxin-antitoxin system VapC family toxin [Fodinibius halophilus]NGP90193.1 type II toxin-antitoxin system VapC family toxin [Fodinibius halophilus]
MSGNNIVADTSLLVNFFNGLDIARKVMRGQQIWISCITEIELLSYSGLTDQEERIIKSFIGECNLIDLHEGVRKLAIDYRKEQGLKVPDAIIAATSAYLDFPLVTMDGDFDKVESLEALILQI